MSKRMTAQNRIPGLLDSYPRERPPLSEAHLARYVDEYKINRSSKGALYRHTEKPDALFHLTDDLNENRDVIDEHPDVAEALREETLRLVHEHQQRGEGLEIKREVSPELLDALRGLGYVQ